MAARAITPAGLRARASRVRALAHSIAPDEASQKLCALASELDAKAAALEAEAATSNANYGQTVSVDPK